MRKAYENKKLMEDVPKRKSLEDQLDRELRESLIMPMFMGIAHDGGKIEDKK